MSGTAARPPRPATSRPGQRAERELPPADHPGPVAGPRHGDVQIPTDRARWPSPPHWRAAWASCGARGQHWWRVRAHWPACGSRYCCPHCATQETWRQRPEAGHVEPGHEAATTEHPTSAGHPEGHPVRDRTPSKINSGLRPPKSSLATTTDKAGHRGANLSTALETRSRVPAGFYESYTWPRPCEALHYKHAGACEDFHKPRVRHA